MFIRSIKEWNIKELMMGSVDNSVTNIKEHTASLDQHITK